jgi:predicted nucleotidyltransferase component of viral defense system
MADPFPHFLVEDRHDALGVVADRSGRPAHLWEKDVWTGGALALYGSALGEHLVFERGTAPSKACQVIRRFSEDVDLTYDMRAIAPDLVAERSEAPPNNRQG